MDGILYDQVVWQRLRITLKTLCLLCNKESVQQLTLIFNDALRTTYFILLDSVYSCSYAYTQHRYTYGHI